jgi:NNP family nitrate/nitrite transporter-like MFS transporter
MVALYNQLLRDGLSRHSAWRAAFAIVPVPVLLFTAILVSLALSLAWMHRIVNPAF